MVLLQLILVVHLIEKLKQYGLLLLLIALVVMVYSSGTSGALYYDDYRPLSQLQAIHDWLSAAVYITSETSGPLGRPLSMLTFALQYQSWPLAPGHFLWFNIVLHAINGILVYLLVVVLLTHLHKQQNTTAFPISTWQWTALFITALWLFSPMQISTSLIAIQRMTGLSAFFLFAGLLFYVNGLSNTASNLTKARWQQLTGLILLTVLAVFSKENGILLPTLALVLERTIFHNQTDPDKKIRLWYLWGCFAVVFGYLLYVVFSTGGVYPFRDFTMLERLLTQPYILLTYLKLAFFPDLFSYNPFHDNIQVFQSDNLPLFAIFSILIVIVLLVVAIRWNRRLPVLSFGILWFFAAHLLESTVIGLELYFEHRNYVALFGPCFAIGWYLRLFSQQHHKLVVLGSVSYFLLLVGITAFIAQLWGKPSQAAELWFEQQFGSERVTEHYALLNLEQGNTMQAYFALQAQVKACDTCIGARLQYALVACAVDDENSMQENIDRVKQLAASQHMIGSAPAVLASFKAQIQNQNCSFLNINQLVALNQLLLQYQTIGTNAGKHFALLLNLHELFDTLNDKAASLQYLQQAFAARPSLQLGEVIFNNLLDDHDPSMADAFLQQLCLSNSSNLFVRIQTQQKCEDMKLRLEQKKLEQP